ncbi:molybdenum cofactor guanylyltransferase [Virgibacillus sp. 179-BFC.A HS]|uniref:Probable molybdenum cofactor guanylyltransferase n=1 Tax=Tigheibacillus jepli TaxID=3035914 RepID=A0ABU5CIF6_9BACI|nr:molybdenum cofactor guanylyltransferase [Virgibacillus sp. 179-BFC.A HS]MDY0405746.1 molybdenum cofactor guanylyltransferase [Virgibacillus sp. 179-BFC.A HS]
MITCGVILAGGQSSRMGTNKALLKINGKSVVSIIAEEMAACTDKQIISANDETYFTFLQLPIIQDRYIGEGPLAGMEATMHQTEADLFFFAACDMPFINHRIYQHLLRQLGDNEAIVPVYKSRLHPLAGVYRKNVLPKIQERLHTKQRKVTSFFPIYKLLTKQTF